MLRQPSISVIVVVYNAAGLLSRSLDSILNQTFPDFELIVVDDGSQDGTADLVDCYAHSDKRIKAFHQQNCGVAAARQKGLDMAMGKYSIFVDADDWIEPEMLELMYKKAEQESADVVFCDYVEHNGLGTFFRKQEPTSRDSRVVLRQMLADLHGSLWNKLIRLSLFRDYGIRFVPGLNNREDECLLIPLFALGLSVAYVNKGLYHYDKNSNTNSISNSWKSSLADEYELALVSIKPYFDDEDLRGIYNNRVAELIKNLTYAPAEQYRRNREFFFRHESAFWNSAMSMKKKIFCALYFYGFRFVSVFRRYLQKQLI